MRGRGWTERNVYVSNLKVENTNLCCWEFLIKQQNVFSRIADEQLNKFSDRDELLVTLGVVFLFLVENE